MNHRIYLDNNSTTFCYPQVIEEMQRILASPAGNPSSIHFFGQKAKAELIESRRIIAAALKVPPHSVVFTSGGTEALNYCLNSFSHLQDSHIVTTALEHAAVEAPLSVLEKKGVRIDRIPADEWGAVSPSALASAINSKTSLLAVIAANNETGVKIDLLACAEIAAAHDIPIVFDGVAWLGKEPIPHLPGKVFWCFSAHKIHGPPGVGAALIPPGLKIEPLIIGGSQQQGRRGGTENLPGICGFASALSLMQRDFDAVVNRMRFLRDRFEAQIFSALKNVQVNGLGPRIANTSNLFFEGVDGEALLFLLDQAGIAASMGSACSSGAIEPSRVLLQMGYSRERALSSLRFSLSSQTTQEEIDTACEEIVQQVKKIKR